MAKNTNYLLNLDVDKLFEDHKIEEIIEIDKLLDSEIERKRVDLRSMVGDRYKDVLTASDAIKIMKTISENLVGNIQSITDCCEDLVTRQSVKRKTSVVIDQSRTIEERTRVMQIHLAMCLNEQIWLALDENDNLKAAQFYLLAQHIHTGISLLDKSFLNKVPFVNSLKPSLLLLKDEIFAKSVHKLQSVEITALDTSSNLNAILLVSNQSCQELLNIFIRHRTTALNEVMNSTHSSVRLQIGAMVKCLITTISLLHGCFMGSENATKGMIWRQLEEISNENSNTTLSKVKLPVSNLTPYIPDIIKKFKPRCKTEEGLKGNKVVIENWLASTKEIIENGLKSSFKLITNVKGLHLIREEALKIELPKNWDEVCSEIGLPSDFNVWFYFFQELITKHVRALITSKILSNIEDIENNIKSIVNISINQGKYEIDLRRYTWNEDNSDISRTENKHIGLSMKAKGYSPNIVTLCENVDKKYLELLTDVSQYLTGKDFTDEFYSEKTTEDFKFKRKFQDKELIEQHLTSECIRFLPKLLAFIQEFVRQEESEEKFVMKSIICARFFHAIEDLAPHFRKCCTLNGSHDKWSSIHENFTSTSLELWQHWLDNCAKKLEERAKQELGNVSLFETVKILARWDTINIQEQTEDRVFDSSIKVPLKPSIPLMKLLSELNTEINRVLPHTIPSAIHLKFIESSVAPILAEYRNISEAEINQNQALQFLFDVKFLTTLCIPRENKVLIADSQSICDKFRSKVDPFDLDVFYSHLRSNVKRAVLQSQVILGCLLPLPSQLSNLSVEKPIEQEKEPTIIALSYPSTSSWFPLLPISAPSQKVTGSSLPKENKSTQQKPGKSSLKKQEPRNVVRSGAAALFGGLTSDWFS